MGVTIRSPCLGKTWRLAISPFHPEVRSIDALDHRPPRHSTWPGIDHGLCSMVAVFQRVTFQEMLHPDRPSSMRMQLPETKHTS